MRLLVLGGTKFLGRAVVVSALERGHEVTLFNRGQTNPDLFPSVEKLRGDRAGELDELRGRGWDAVIDTSAYVPSQVRWTTELLRDAAAHYLIVSSVSAYASHAQRLREDCALAQLQPEHSAEELRDDYANYGALKALCEHVVAEDFADGHAIVRAGLIVGPHDPTGRLTYWPHRVVRGGDVLAPGPDERKVQFIDVRDLSAWMVQLSERKQVGVFNATHPGVAWGDLIDACQRVAHNGARVVWVSDDFLVAQGVGEWMELPLWVQDPQWRGLHETDVSRALAAGLRIRSLDDTVRGALEQAEPTTDAGLTPQREAELLRMWSEWSERTPDHRTG